MKITSPNSIEFRKKQEFIKSDIGKINERDITQADIVKHFGFSNL